MQKFNYETKRWGITPITNKYTDFQGLEMDYFVEDILLQNANSKWKVVDLGCGGGNIAAFLKNKFKNWQITGIDISRDVINLASAKFPQIKFECASAEKIPGNKGSQDLIYAFDTLEHFENLTTVLSRIRDNLRIGGVFYAAIPLEKQFPSLYWLLYKLGWMGKQKFAGHVNFFDSWEFIQLVESYGFRTVKVRYSNHPIFSLFDIAYYLVQSVLGKQSVSLESSITQLHGGIKKSVFKAVKNVFSAITFFESKLLWKFPGGKGHFLFVRGDKDFFSYNPPFSLLEAVQLKHGLNRIIRPKDLVIKRYLERLDFAKAKTILDFGCADGIWLERLLSGNRKVGLGVDIAQKLIDAAKARKGRKGEYFMTMNKWPIKEKSVDFCVSFDTFEHIENKKYEAEKIFQSLKPGGKFLFYQLNHNNKYTFDWIFESIGSDMLYRRADHRREIFSLPHQFAKILEEVGFKKVNVELYDGPANLFWDVFCYSYLSILQRVLRLMRLDVLMNPVIMINTWLVYLLVPVNFLLDFPLVNKGYSNGFFVWGEK